MGIAAMISSTQILGARLLKEIGNEEGSLEAVSYFLQLGRRVVDKLPYR